MGNGNIIKNKSEPFGPLNKLLPHRVTEHLPVSDQLSGVELGHNGLEDLVGDAGQHPLVIVHTQGGVNVGQTVRAGSKNAKK